MVNPRGSGLLFFQVDKAPTLHLFGKWELNGLDTRRRLLLLTCVTRVSLEL